MYSPSKEGIGREKFAVQDEEIFYLLQDSQDGHLWRLQLSAESGELLRVVQAGHVRMSPQAVLLRQSGRVCARVQTAGHPVAQQLAAGHQLLPERDQFAHLAVSPPADATAATANVTGESQTSAAAE